jgi:hypothetical protein
MAKVAPFHSVKASDRRVYHDKVRVPTLRTKPRSAGATDCTPALFETSLT